MKKDYLGLFKRVQPKVEQHGYYATIGDRVFCERGQVCFTRTALSMNMRVNMALWRKAGKTQIIDVKIIYRKQ